MGCTMVCLFLFCFCFVWREDGNADAPPDATRNPQSSAHVFFAGRRSPYVAAVCIESEFGVMLVEMEPEQLFRCSVTKDQGWHETWAMQLIQRAIFGPYLLPKTLGICLQFGRFCLTSCFLQTKLNHWDTPMNSPAPFSTQSSRNTKGNKRK